MYGYIYKIINDNNDKVYVGKTTRNINRRFKEHINCVKLYENGLYKHQTKLYKAMSKYGVDNFHVEIIDYASSKDELNEKEKLWIEKLDTIENGYNISKGGDGGDLFRGHHHKEETKKYIGSLTKGKPQDKNFAKRRCIKNKKKVLCLETKEIFDSLGSANEVYGSSVRDSIYSGRRCKGYHFIYLKENSIIDDLYIKRELELIEKRSLERIKNGRKKVKDHYKNFSEEQRLEYSRKMSERSRLRYSNWSEEDRKKFGEKMSSIKKGQKLSEEAKKKVGEKSKGRNKGKHLYNNGVEQRYFYDDCVPDGYVKGVLPYERKINK